MSEIHFVLSHFIRYFFVKLLLLSFYSNGNRHDFGAVEAAFSKFQFYHLCFVLFIAVAYCCFGSVKSIDDARFYIHTAAFVLYERASVWLNSKQQHASKYLLAKKKEREKKGFDHKISHINRYPFQNGALFFLFY